MSHGLCEKRKTKKQPQPSNLSSGHPNVFHRAQKTKARGLSSTMSEKIENIGIKSS